MKRFTVTLEDDLYAHAVKRSKAMNAGKLNLSLLMRTLVWQDKNRSQLKTNRKAKG